MTAMVTNPRWWCVSNGKYVEGIARAGTARADAGKKSVLFDMSAGARGEDTVSWCRNRAV